MLVTMVCDGSWHKQMDSHKQVLSGMHEVFMWCVEIHHLWNVGVPYSQENNQSSNFCHTNASQTTRATSF